MKAGKLTEHTYSAIFFNGLISLILLLFVINYFSDFGQELQLITALLAVCVITIMVIRYKQLLLYSLGFLIPLSIPFSLGSSKIILPSELICVFLTGFFFLKLMLGTRLNRRLLSHPITILILLDLAWLFISSAFSQMPEVSFKRFIIRLCYYIAFYYFSQELFRQQRGAIKRLFTLHVCGLLFIIAYSTAKHAALSFTTVGSQQISAPFYFDHTIYGACLVFFIPFLIYHSFAESPLREKYFYRILLAILVIATFLSYSRAAWLSVIAALGVYFVLQYKIKLRYLLWLTAFGLAILLLNQQRIGTFLKDNKEISHSNDVGRHLKSISNVNTDASNKERINRWKCALRMFADKPLTGFGPGTYQFFYGRYQQHEDLTRISTFNGTKGHAHSEYLNYLSETGLIGCIIFISLIVVTCIRSVKLIRRSYVEPALRPALYIFAGLITFFIHAFFNGFLEFEKVAMPVFSSLAAICSLDLEQEPHLHV